MPPKQFGELETKIARVQDQRQGFITELTDRTLKNVSGRIKRMRETMDSEIEAASERRLRDPVERILESLSTLAEGTEAWRVSANHQMKTLLAKEAKLREATSRLAAEVDQRKSEIESRRRKREESLLEQSEKIIEETHHLLLKGDL